MMAEKGGLGRIKWKTRSVRRNLGDIDGWIGYICELFDLLLFLLVIDMFDTGVSRPLRMLCRWLWLIKDL